MIRVREVRTVKELKSSDSLCLLIANLVQLHGIIRVRKVQWDADCRYVMGTGIGFFPFKWTFVVLWYFVFAGGTHWQWGFLAKSLLPNDYRLLDF